MRQYKHIITTAILSLVCSIHIFADINPIVAVDFSKEWDADAIKVMFRKAGYESVYELDSTLYGCTISCYSNTKEIDQFKINVEFTPKTKKVYRVKIIQDIPTEDFSQAAIKFLQEIVKQYGNPPSGVFAKNYYDYDSEESPINVEKYPLDSINLKMFISEKKPIRYRWQHNGINIYYEINKLSNYNPEITCTIENERMQKLLANEEAFIEAEKKEKENTEKIRDIIFLCIGIAITLLTLYFVIKTMIAKHKEEQEKLRLQQEEIEIKQKETDKKYNAFINDTKARYGEPVRVIPIEFYDDNFILLHNDILVFPKAKIVIIGQNEYSYSDILSCTLIDNNPQDFTSGQVTTTKVNTGSMVGRAVVGGLTLGVAGAVVGALTASKETSSETTDTNHFGMYDIKINVKSITNPTLVLNLYNKKDLAEEIYSLLQAIIAMK